MSSQNRPCRYPPDGCAAIRNREGRRYRIRVPALPPTIDPHRLRWLQPVLHASGRRRDARPLLSINVKRERRRIAWLAMIGRLVTVSATFIHYV